MQVDVQLEISRAGLAFESRTDALRIKCPFHADESPSLDVFIDNGSFKCYACQKAGDLIALLSQVEGRPRYAIESELRGRYGGDERPVDAAQVERFHSQLGSDARLMGALRDRGVSDESIRKFRLGRDNDRITIPIAAPSGLYVNIRRYFPDLPPGDKRPKMTNMRGRGKRLWLYPYPQIRFDKILLCGGEIKSIVASQLLNSHGIGCITVTGGEGNWAPTLEGFFKGKIVYVCNDIDEAGHFATQLRCERLERVAAEVRPVYLPLDAAKFPKGDINDFATLDYESAADRLLDLIVNAELWQGRDNTTATDVVVDEQIYDADLNIVSDAQIVNKRIKAQLRVSAIDETAYYIPKVVKIECGQDQDVCAICPVFKGNLDQMTIGNTSSAVLAMMNTSKTRLNDELRDALGIPVCRSVKFTAMESYKAVEARVQRPLGLTEHASSRLNVPAVFVDYDAELNGDYEVLARVLPHPKTQASTVLIESANAVADALDTFVIEDISVLQQFQPEELTFECIKAKLSQQYKYLASNVTRINGRERLHALVDLTYHSVLSIKPSPVDRPIKGWLELLIIGDSSQGKTEVTKNLSEWYQLGARVDCKNATVAGLIGGLEQMNGRWFAQWGELPTHDRRLVILEEIKGLPKETLAKLTDTRSSGVAQIPKIRRAAANARTRIIAVSNPARTRVTMSNYAFGCQAVAELVPNPEDVRRFDAAVILNKDDISTETMNRRVALGPVLYTNEDARKLVLWAWTRKIDDIIVTPEAWEACMVNAEKLCSTYSDILPLFDRGSTRFKLLRWATACAARVFSTDDGVKLIVRPEHVQFIVELLEEEYKAPAHGYFDYSQTQVKRSYTMDTDEIGAALRQLSLNEQSIDLLLQMQDLEQQDIMDIGGVSRDEASLLLSRLVRAGALVREERFYVKAPGFIAYLRNVRSTIGNSPFTKQGEY